MIPPSISLRSPSALFRRGLYVACTGLLALLAGERNSSAIDILRSSPGSSVHGTAAGESPAAGLAQAATAATAATSQQAETATLSALAQSSLMRATAALHAQQQAQAAARALALGAASTVPNGLVLGGLVPGVVGTDPARPVAVPVTIQRTSTGTGIVTLAPDTSVTLPTTVSGNSQVTVSGTGTVGSITTGGTITALQGGTTASVAPGSTISLPKGGTLTFAGGSAGAIPSSLATYALPASWSGISGLSQASYTSGGQTTVTLDQTSQQALLTWQSFNIGRNTVLDFDQSAGGNEVGQWVAINRVADNIAPSQILGAIQAPGQVYVINQNGILFSGTSQINVGALVAASLPINTNLINRGLLNNPDDQFLFTQANQAAGGVGPTPAFTAPAAPTTGAVANINSAGNTSAASGADGDIIVEAGAQLTSLDNAENVGGKIALVGPNVANDGTITTPDGQAILAAGNQVAFQAHNSADASLRGLDVYVGSVNQNSGTALNNGLLEAPRADVTMTGKNVDQDGVIDSSTSVALNGRIDLLADYGTEAITPSTGGPPVFYPTESGLVTLGAGSLSQILPELSSSATVVGTQLALPSVVNIQGDSIYMGDNSLLSAPGATNSATGDLGLNNEALSTGVTLNAGTWVLTTNAYVFSNTAGQIYLDSNALIDVSGSENVQASVTQDIVSAQLLGSELANSPLQRNGPLRGQTVEVNLLETGVYDGTPWIGTPLADVSGYVNLIQRTVGELTSSGGSVALKAGGSVVLQHGSSVNVSGGWINYQGADVETSKVISGGHILDISQATPNLVYQGLLGDFTVSTAKYGLSETYNDSLETTAEYQSGYLQGGNGGTLSITAPTMVIDGTLSGNTVAGSSQRTPQTQLGTTYTGTSFLPTVLITQGIPTYGSLALLFDGMQPGTVNRSDETSPNVTLATDQEIGQQPSAPIPAFSYNAGNPASLPVALENSVVLSQDLVNTDGFSDLTIETNEGGSFNASAPGGISTTGGGLLTIASGVTLSGAPAATMSFNAANIDVNGSISAPGSSLTFTSSDFSPYAVALTSGNSTPPLVPNRGTITLGSAAALNVEGLVANQSVANNIPNVFSGGSVTIDGYNASLANGSSINASGGVNILGTGSLSYGNGGQITIEAGEDPMTVFGTVGGHLSFNPGLVSLSAYSGAKGGSLSIRAPLLQIGGSTLLNGDTTGSTLLLSPGFFDQGGFGSFNLDAVGTVSPPTPKSPTILIAPNTAIAPEAESLLASVTENGVQLTPTFLPDAASRTPVSLSFSSGVSAGGRVETIGNFLMDPGASIVTDPDTTGGVTINTNNVTVLGEIDVPGGDITIHGSTASTIDITAVAPTVDLGPQSILTTQGVVELTPNIFNPLTGSALGGGNISVSGNIVAQAGSRINVSGVSGVLDLVESTHSPGSLVTVGYVPTTVDSKGGTITLTGGQELFTDATLLGAAGGPGAVGGTLIVSSGRGYASLDVPTPEDIDLQVTQSGPTIPTNYTASGEAVIGTPLPTTDPAGNPIPFIDGHFAANSFQQGGFDSLTLGGVVQFVGSVSIAARDSLIIGNNSGFIYTGPAAATPTVAPKVTLSAPYVDLGLAFQGPLTPALEITPFLFPTGLRDYVAPTYSNSSGVSGVLNVDASTLLDVGDLSLQDTGSLNVNKGTAAGAVGDIRGDGILDVAGSIYLRANQIYPTTETAFTVAAHDYTGGSGSVTIADAGNPLPQIPLSAGGTLNIFATDITQAGVLRAPIGTINLGSGVISASPVDLLTNLPFDATQNLTLSTGSVTDVSAVDPDGRPVTIPYGTNLNGTSWIDPSGTDITTGGVPGKTVNISAVNVADKSGSTIDVNGGGDLYAYRFVSGLGGTTDILASSSSFAVIPGYTANYAAMSPYNQAPASTGPTNPYSQPVTADNGYVNGSLQVGEKIYLNASNGLPAGTYTLLPARYALLPGAFLVTPQSSVPPSPTQAQPDGSSLVSGYEFSALDPAQAVQPIYSTFEVDPQSVVQSRAEYDNFSANSFLAQSAVANSVPVPRLPVDAGQIVVAAVQTLSIQGMIASQVPSGGLGSLVDISSPSNIYIGVANAAGNAPAGVPSTDLFLDSAEVSAFGADSLLIGGYRTTVDGGTQVTVTTNDLTVNNPGAGNALSGPDLILAANQDLVVDHGSTIDQGSRTLSGSAETLLLGNAGDIGSGDGVLIRVSSDPNAQITRTGVDTQTDQAQLGAQAPALTIDPNVTIGGVSIILDSTHATSLDPTTALRGNNISLDSGQVSLELTSPSVPPTTVGLVLSNQSLQNLQASVKSLSLLSYSSIDIYGSGQIGATGSSGNFLDASLALHAAGIRGFDEGSGAVTIDAQNILIDNSPGGTVPASAVPLSSGSLTLNAGTITLGGGSGQNVFQIAGYSNITMDAANGILARQTASIPNAGGVTDINGNTNPSESVQPGSTDFTTPGNLTITTSLITGATGANLGLAADGALTINAPAKAAASTLGGGLGANLTLSGATLNDSSAVVANSGTVSLDATSGDLTVGSGGKIDAGGTAQVFNDLTEYTSGGQINLASATGSVLLAAGSTVNVSAQPGGGDAGTLDVSTSSASTGTFTADGAITGQGGAGGQGGSFSLDVGSLSDLAPLDALLNPVVKASGSPTVLGGFTQSQSFQVHNGSVAVDGTAATQTFSLSADAGSVTVTGQGLIAANGSQAGTSTATIDVATSGSSNGLLNPGQTGGAITLQASGDVALDGGSLLTVGAKNFSNAGQGGAVSLETTTGRITLGAGSTVDLSVATPAAANSGDLTGTLHLRAPQLDANGNGIGTNGTATPVSIAVDPIAGNVIGAGSIAVEGFYQQDAATPGVVSISGNAGDGALAGTNYKSLALANATAFMLNAPALQTTLIGTNAGLANVLYLSPGEEIDNSQGSLVLNQNWSLSSARFGPENAPGFLTLRASGNLIFDASLSDGFTAAANSSNSTLDTAPLMPFNAALPANAQSWSYNLAAGADFNAVNSQQVVAANMTYDPMTGLPTGPVTGSLELGLLDGAGIAPGESTARTVANYYQVIRTGTGAINIATGGDVQLLNQLATIYTAGVQAPALPTGQFQNPILAHLGSQGQLGPVQESTFYPAQYSYAGGNLVIDAEGSVEHETATFTGTIIPDSERQLPDNWLDRRGYVVNGQFGTSGNGDIASTSWWVDFSNFFEGVGALGGGNVSLLAGRDIDNVDAVIPTNARVTNQTATGDKTAADQTEVELGGGNLLVQAGDDINAGVYYVERGNGTLTAGNSIITNATRSPSLGILNGLTDPQYDPEQTWLPTTLFLGVGNFTVQAQNSLLLGPVANTFLLPEGVNNTYFDKTYFSTYGTSDSVNVSSLTGAVTMQEDATLPGDVSPTGLLESWLMNVDLLTTNPNSPSFYQPWISINETDVTDFASVSALLPPALHVTSFSGDANLVGDITLSPAPEGTVDVLAADSINGLQRNGVSPGSDASDNFFGSSTINLSDANFNAIPGALSPFAFQEFLISEGLNGTFAGFADTSPSGVDFLSSIDDMLTETGSTQGTLQQKQELHADINGNVLHAADPNPVHLYAKTGDISGVELFSGKPADIVAGQDVTDISFYLQNDNAAQVSIVAAGRDIIAYDPNSPLLTNAQASGNNLDQGDGPLPGDIQIGGPGTLEVLAGRNLNLGVGPSNGDGTGAGLTSIGNDRNPTLPVNESGADITAAAGIGSVDGGLNSSQLNFGNVIFNSTKGTITPDDPADFTRSFIANYLSPVTGGGEAATYLPELASLMGLPAGDSDQQVWTRFSQLPAAQQDTYALSIFYLVLRDSGRNHTAGTGGGYATGYAAIADLFPTSRPGDISITSREIVTENGGNINLLVPDGQVNVGLNVAGTQAADQGILTQDGGNIAIFADSNINVGTSRIFTLRGGNEILYSTHGNIAAGASSKTVQSASPTRVLIDSQSGAVETDLAGLATGGGIGVLETVVGVPPSDVDLIAPNGIVDAGDAGIRASGNLNIAAVQVLNAGNITVGGKSTGVPTTSAPNVAGISAASSAIGAATNSSISASQQAQSNPAPQTELPSIVNVEVLGYGGGEG